MFTKQRFVCMLLAALMIVTLAACGKGNDTQKTTEAAAPADQEQTTADGAAQTQSSESAGGETAGSQAPEGAKLSGKLSIIDLEDRDASILRGIRITGNRIGSEKDINGKESSLTDVRCVFELNEWIEFYPDTDAEYYLRVWVIQHRDDQEYYNKCKFSDMMPGFASYCDLHYPVDEADPESACWGTFYLNPDDCKAGYYDFVFTYEGKAIAVLQTRFYDEGQLDGKSGAELEALMHE